MIKIYEKELLKTINFSIIVPWYGGNIQRENSLRNMLNCLKMQIEVNTDDPNIYELIIVEQIKKGEEDIRKKRILEIMPQELAHFRYIQLKKDGTFNKSWCMNVGARKASYQHLLFIDADSLFGQKYLTTIKHFIRKTPNPRNKLMFCWNYIICLIGKDNPISRHIRPDTTRAMGGIWYVEKYFYFNEFGGMNENYEGYGGEDNDAYERASYLFKSPHVSYMAYPLVHQYHDWEKPSENCVKYFEITRRNPEQIIEKLKNIERGNMNSPTYIKMKDLL